MAPGNKLFSLIFPTPIYGNPNNVFRLVTYLFLYFKRFEDPAHPLLKEMWILSEESQTPKEFILQLTGNNEAIKMEGMFIMMRLLGSMGLSHCKTRYRRTVSADPKGSRSSRWRRFLDKTWKFFESLSCTMVNVDDFIYLCELQLQEGEFLPSEHIRELFEKVVARRETIIRELGTGTENEELEKMLYQALYLLMLYSKSHVSEQNDHETAAMTDLLPRLFCSNPRTWNGNTLLHLAVWHGTPYIVCSSYDREHRMCGGMFKPPCLETMRLILHAGCDVNAMNIEGNTPLHLAVTFKPGPGQEDVLKETLDLLLLFGADTKLENNSGRMAMDCCETDEAQRILSAMDIDVRNVRKY